MECSFAFKSHVKEKKKWTGEGRSGGIGGKSTLIRWIIFLKYNLKGGFQYTQAILKLHYPSLNALGITVWQQKKLVKSCPDFCVAVSKKQ